MGSIATYDDMCRNIGHLSAYIVISVDYRYAECHCAFCTQCYKHKAACNFCLHACTACCSTKVAPHSSLCYRQLKAAVLPQCVRACPSICRLAWILTAVIGLLCIKYRVSDKSHMAAAVTRVKSQVVVSSDQSEMVDLHRSCSAATSLIINLFHLSLFHQTATSTGLSTEVQMTMTHSMVLPVFLISCGPAG